MKFSNGITNYTTTVFGTILKNNSTEIIEIDFELIRIPSPPAKREQSSLSRLFHLILLMSRLFVSDQKKVDDHSK